MSQVAAAARLRRLPVRRAHHASSSSEPAVVATFVITLLVSRSGQLLSSRVSAPFPSPAPRPYTRRSQHVRRAVSQAAPPAISATSVGGCVLVSGGGTVELANVVISGGRAVMGSGLAAVGVGSVLVRDSVLSGNGVEVSSGNSGGVFGGGAYLSGCGAVEMRDVEVRGNALASSRGDIV